MLFEGLYNCVSLWLLRQQIWEEPGFRICWMKLCSSDKSLHHGATISTLSASTDHWGVPGNEGVKQWVDLIGKDGRQEILFENSYNELSELTLVHVNRREQS